MKSRGPGPGLSGIWHSPGETGKLPQASQASLPLKPQNPPEWGRMRTHRDKVGAGKVPNDSRGCADAHVADDGEKPPVKKRTEKGQNLGGLQLVRQTLGTFHPV